MKKRRSSRFFQYFSLVQLPHSNSLSGAEGFGKYTTGGRGGRVMIVTNLHDSGPGSLREAVESEGPRIVVFAVDGEHPPRNTPANQKRRYYYCRSKRPGDGICLTDCALVVDASNVIVRYLRVRVGDKFSTDTDGIGGGRYGQKNVILDHLSVTWSIDECLSIYKTENVTVNGASWHSLTRSKHTKGSHRIRRHLGRSESDISPQSAGQPF